MLEGLTRHVGSIRDYLNQFFDDHLKQLESGSIPVAGEFDADVLRRLKEYVVRGKLLRGALVFLGYEAARGPQFSEPDPKAERRCLAAAAAMELTQSFLLIHDDIMDKDDVRRGVPSLHRQYRELARERGVEDADHLGVSLGICVGDVGVFLAMELLAQADPALLGTYARELNLVGLAQMDDVFFGQAPEEPTVDRIIQVYRFKTGRYTFSLPLVLGAALAGADTRTQEALARFGEELGVVFQIKDDEIGLFGEEEHIGKPAGSDISANKKTVFRQLLIAADAPAETMALFGRPSLSKEQVETVRRSVHDKEVLSAADSLVATHRRAALEALGTVVSAEHPARPVFDDLVAFNDQRTR
jgi:geranylgeranyl diphosphate synthase type I